MHDRWKALEPFTDPLERWICDATTPNALYSEWLKIEPTAPPTFYPIEVESHITYSCDDSGRETALANVKAALAEVYSPGLMSMMGNERL